MVLRQSGLEGIRQFPAKGSPEPGGQVGYGAVDDQEVVLVEEREYRLLPLFPGEPSFSCPKTSSPVIKSKASPATGEAAG